MVYRIGFIWALFTGLLAVWPAVANAQVNPNVPTWSFGKVYLASGDTISGRLTFYRKEDIIKVDQPGNPTLTFSPVNVQGFAVKEESMLTYKDFRTLPWNRKNDPNGYRSPAFFEFLQEGQYSLFKREIYTKVRNSGTGLNPMGMPVPYNVNGYEVEEYYYLLTPDNKVIPLRNLKKDLKTLFGNKEKQMDAFILENNLRYNKEHHLKTIIRYYNSLL